MDQLVEQGKSLDALITDVQSRYRAMRLATEAFSKYASTGTGDPNQFLDRVSDTTQSYHRLREQAVNAACAAQEQFCGAAHAARLRGVQFSEHPAEQPIPSQPDEYDISQLIDALAQVSSGIRALVESATEFDSAQVTISVALDRVMFELARLEALDANCVECAAVFNHLKTRVADVSEPRQPLLNEFRVLLEAVQSDALHALSASIDGGIRHVEAEVTRLGKLGEHTRPFEELLEGLRVRNDNLKECLSDVSARFGKSEAQADPLEAHARLLADIRASLIDVQAHAQRVRSALDHSMDEQVSLVTEILAEIHPEMPEAKALVEMLSYRQALEDAAFIAYQSELRSLVVEARHAGWNALNRYEQQIAADNGYLFTSMSEAEQVGTALRLVADQADQYSEHLWEIGEDILLRIMLAGWDAEDFYNQFGYPTIVRALNAALERSELPQALGFLNTAFLPPMGDSPNERISALLREPAIHDIFGRALLEGALILDQTQFKTLDQGHHKAVLALLEHADDLSLPAEVRLQWAALLHDAFPPGSLLHHEASYQFLVVLLETRHYVAFYYSLMALGAQYPDLWDRPEFRPVFRHVVDHALQIEGDTGQFLIDVCTNPGVARMVAGDPGLEFALASLAHFLAIRLGQVLLVNQAWERWEQMAVTYPTLGAILLRHLQGEQFSHGTPENAKELKRNYEKLLTSISSRMAPRSYKGNRLAILIHRWYVSNYMSDWFEHLKSDEFTEKQVAILLKQIQDVQRSRDLVDECPLEHDPLLADGRMGPVEGGVRDNLNSRLFELLSLFQQAVSMRKQLMHVGTEMVPRQEIEQELRRLCESSETTVWALKSLIRPVLPLVANSLEVEAGS